MFSEGKIIYSKRFPLPNLGQPGEETEETPEDRDAANASLKAFRQKVQRESVFVLRPDKLAQRQRFIDLAKELSLTYRIDMDITKRDYSITVDMYLSCNVYTGTVKEMLAGLLNMCDRIGFCPPKAGPWDITLCLDYNTHDHYLSGHKID